MKVEEKFGHEKTLSFEDFRPVTVTIQAASER